MPEVTCSGCGKRLRVPDDRAGRKAKCPSCNAIFVVPHAHGAASMSTAPDASQPLDRWSLKTAEGEVFGPVSKMELDSWAAQGRMTTDSQVWQEGTAQWQWARDVYPILGKAGVPPVVSGGSTNPFAEIGDLHDANPYVSPRGGPTVGRPGKYARPHRGGTILTLGILSWVLCVICGACAWAMGHADLREMRAGRMDRSGMGMTQAGMILGMIHCIIALVAIPLLIILGSI
jgi:hypothetical protein